MARGKLKQTVEENVSTDQRDQVFKILDAVQDCRTREALTRLKCLLEPIKDPEISSYSHVSFTAHCNLGNVSGDSSDKQTTRNMPQQQCWRLPFRGFSHQVYAILKEEWFLSRSFDSILRRLEASISSHPRQVRKLLEERKKLRSKGTNDLRAWVRLSDDLLKESIMKQAEIACSNDSHSSYDQESGDGVKVMPPADVIRDESDKFSTIYCDTNNPNPVDCDTHCRDPILYEPEGRAPAYSHFGNQEISSFDSNNFDALSWDADDQNPIPHNTNRQTLSITNLESYSLKHATDAWTGPVALEWKHGAGRKKSWKFRPVERIPTRRQRKGFRDVVLDAKDMPALLSSDGTESEEDVPKGICSQRTYRLHRRLAAKHSERKGCVWGWNRSSQISKSQPDDVMSTGHCPQMHEFLPERIPTKAIVRYDAQNDRQGNVWIKSKPASDLDSKSSDHAIAQSPHLTCHRPLGSTFNLNSRKLFTEEKRRFESMLSSIPERLPGFNTRKPKRRGVNKFKIPSFDKADQILPFIESTWHVLLDNMEKLKQSFANGWNGTQESYLAKRRTFHAWRSRIEQLEVVYLLVQEQQAEWVKLKPAIGEEVEKFAVLADQPQCVLPELPWMLRKNPSTTFKISESFHEIPDWPKLIHYGLISNKTWSSVCSEHWAMQNLLIAAQVTAAYSKWCRMNEHRINSLLNSMCSGVA